MFPDLPAQENTDLSEPRMGKVFLFDFEAGHTVMRDGMPVEATYEQAIRQWVAMVMLTERDKYRVYRELDHGIQFAQFVGRKDIPVAVIISEVKRQIEEQLIRHPEIEAVDNFELDRKDGIARISFSVQTKRGDIQGIESEVRYHE